MGEPARRLATYDDLCALPEHLIGEIIDGDLYASPRPGPRHISSASVLGMGLGPYHGRRGRDPDRPGGWWILDELELHLGRDVVVPDLAAWRRERMPTLPSEAYFTLVPDWVCEVVSPSTENLDRVRKKVIYAREGVEYMWLVNPSSRTLEVLRREGSSWKEIGLYEGDCSVRAEPFDGIELDLARLWEQG